MYAPPCRLLPRSNRASSSVAARSCNRFPAGLHSKSYSSGASRAKVHWKTVKNDFRSRSTGARMEMTLGTPQKKKNTSTRGGDRAKGAASVGSARPASTS